MPYNKSTQRNYGDSPLSKKGLALNKEIDKDTESGGYTGQPKQHGSPFEMKITSKQSFLLLSFIVYNKL